MKKRKANVVAAGGRERRALQWHMLLSADEREMLERLAESAGVNKAVWIRMAIRAASRAEADL